MVINLYRGEREHEYRITRSKTVMEGISSAGYNPLCAVLELEFSGDGQVWQFYDVPEHVWYEWRNAEKSGIYFHTCISGRYESRQIAGLGRQK